MTGINPEEFFGLLEEVNHLRMAGHYEAALSAAHQCSDMARRYFGERHPSMAAALNSEGLLHQDMANYGAAVPLYQQALAIQREAFGDENPLVAISLDNLAQVYQATGDYAAAEPMRLQALAIARRTLGDDHPTVATVLSNLAVLYNTMGNYQAAEPLHLIALDIRRRVLGEDHPQVAISLDELGLLYQKIGNFKAAEPLHLQALAITRKVRGDQHPDVANSMSNLAQLYRVTGRYQMAEPLYQQALAIRRNVLGERHPAVAASLNNLALLYRTTGNYQAAEPLYRKALAICRQTLGDAHLDVAISMDNLASLYQETGHYSAAEPLYRQALTIRRRVLGEEHPDVADTLNNLALLYQKTGDTRAAEVMYREALAIRRKVSGGEHPSIATILGNQALLHRTIGDYRAARPLYEEALAIRRKALGDQHPDVADNLNNLAALHHTTGDYGAAEPLYREALAIQRNALGEQHPAVADLLSNLGTLYQAMGDFQGAEPLHRQALAIRLEVLGEEHPDVALSLNELAALHSASGDYRAAEPLYRSALAIRRKALGDLHLNVAISLDNLASVCVATDRADEARSLMIQAAEIFDRTIWQVFSFGSESQRMSVMATIAGTLDAFLSLVLEHFNGQFAPMHEAFDLVLRRKAIGAEALAEQRDAVLRGRYPELQLPLRELASLRQRIGQKSLAGPGTEGRDAHQRLIAELVAQQEQLEAQLARRLPEMNLERRLRAADRRAVAAALPEGSALIEFVRCEIRNFGAVVARGEPRWRPARYLAFVLPAQGPDEVQLIDLGEAAQIDGMISTFREAITGGPKGVNARSIVRRRKSAANTSESEGTALRGALFDPLITALSGRRRLFLAADGDLNGLPFEVLPAGDGRLIDEYRISYLGVGRDALRFDAVAPERSSDPIVVADPDFDLGTNEHLPKDIAGPRGRQSRDLQWNGVHFDRLPGTRLEGKRIGEVLGVPPLMDADASESCLRGGNSPRILHLATHGFFLPCQSGRGGEEMRMIEEGSERMHVQTGSLSAQKVENPLLRSGLALAGANTWLRGEAVPAEAGDGLLTAEDVSGLDLLDTELVVLSACDTGLGEVRVQEGVFGLRRTFTLAGARTLVMSLWKVPDRQTQELMMEFYRRLLSGAARADALREAQLAMMAKYPDPFYWGAFICQGNPDPLRSLDSTAGQGGSHELVRAAEPSEGASQKSPHRTTATSNDAESKLRKLLLDATFTARADGLHSGWPLHQRALELDIGAPLHARGERIAYQGHDYVYQVFARDTLFADARRLQEVRRLGDLVQGNGPTTSGLGLALVEASYQSVGAVFRPSDAYQQRAATDRIGYPLSERRGTRQYDFQVFSGDVLYDSLPKTVPKDPRAIQRLSDDTGRWGDYLWADVYRALGLPFEPTSPFHRLAIGLWIGLPLGPVRAIELEGSIVEVQVFTLDTLYAGPDHVVHRMSAAATFPAGR